MATAGRGLRYSERAGLACEAAAQHLPLGAEAGRLFGREAGAAQAFAHLAGDRPGGERRVRGSEAGEQMEDALGPQRGILRRGEAVEIERVGARVDAREAVGGIAEEERQGDAARVQVQSVQPGREHRPLRAQLGRKGGELGPGGVDAGEILAAEGVQLAGDEVQAGAAAGILAPRRPGGEEVQSGAEAGLDDGEALTPLPALRQAVARNEDRVRLAERIVARVVDVAEGARVQHALGRALEAGGMDRHGEGKHRAPARSVGTLRAADAGIRARVPG